MPKTKSKTVRVDLDLYAEIQELREWCWQSMKYSPRTDQAAWAYLLEIGTKVAQKLQSDGVEVPTLRALEPQMIVDEKLSDLKPLPSNADRDED